MMNTNLDLLATLDQIGQPNILVIGDFMLDRYTWGNAERVSQEAPVLLLQVDKEEEKLGGAGNVCQALSHLGARVMAAGILGSDFSGDSIRSMLTEIGVDCELLAADPKRPTTTKNRFMGRAANRHPHQILRVDRETHTEMPPALIGTMIHKIEKKIADIDAILLSDYDKGSLSPLLVRRVIDLARQQQIPIIVDPAASRDYTLYRGATLMTPNRSEAEHATGMTINDPLDAILSARSICAIAELQMAIVTIDKDGMVLAERNGEGNIFPIDPRSVYDITGAGDIVLATVGLCIAAKKSGPIAARLANIAAGIAVEQVGAAMIEREELRQRLIARRPPMENKLVELLHAKKIVDVHRATGKRIVFTNGCFDLLHVGHITNLHQAAELGDLLVVGLNSDHSVRQLKGDNRPVIGQRDRAAILAALQCVDYVIIFNQDAPLELIEVLRPDVLVKGGDYEKSQIVGKELVESYGGIVITTPLVEGVSTTRILEAASV
tara:strand:- start:507 stop:1988 length:1482 start_codon:yes stop_codon:yes gene_type:complete